MVLGPDDFEIDFGSWSNVGGDTFDWTRDSGGTPSSGTGPSVDHTEGTSSGFYLFTEASSPRNSGDSAILESPCLDLTGMATATLGLWRHMDDGDVCTADSCDAVTGCGHAPIAGCGAEVPGVPGVGLALLSLQLLAAGGLMLSRRRRSGR